MHIFDLRLDKTFSVGMRNTITPSGQMDYFQLTGSEGPRQGKILNGGIAFVHTVNQRFDIANEAHFMRDIQGAFGLQPKTNIYSYEGSIGWNVTPRWEFTPKITYGGTFNDSGRPAKATFSFEARRNFSIRAAN